MFSALDIDFVGFKTFRNRGSSWLVITRSGGLYCRVLLWSSVSALAFKQLVVRFRAISDRFLGHLCLGVPDRWLHMLFVWSAWLVFKSPFSYKANDSATKMPFILIILLFSWCEEAWWRGTVRFPWFTSLRYRKSVQGLLGQTAFRLKTNLVARQTPPADTKPVVQCKKSWRFHFWD